jgi:quercetin dioxygenase-like cupin family protein
MAQAGDVLDNPFTGQRLTFLRTAADTGGELLEMESNWTLGGDQPAVHYHPHQEEHFEVLEGELRATVDGAAHTLRTGDVLDLPPGTPHSMWNPGPAPARALWQTRPALRSEEFFEMVWRLARTAKEDPENAPDPDRVAAMMRDFEDVFRLGRPGSG